MTRQPSRSDAGGAERSTGGRRYRRQSSRRTTQPDTTVTNSWPPRLNTRL
jgi:hypothetical protein